MNREKSFSAFCPKHVALVNFDQRVSKSPLYARGLVTC